MKKMLSYCIASSLLAVSGCICCKDKSSIAGEYISTIKEWENKAELSIVPTMHWYSSSECRILCSSEKFVSFKITTETYTGGAHGSTTTKVGTVKNGKVLKLSDLPKNIKPAWEDAVAGHFKAKNFAEYMKTKPAFEPYMTENFYLDKTGIHFIYNPYELDCYAAGTIDIFVPMSTKLD